MIRFASIFCIVIVLISNTESYNSFRSTRRSQRNGNGAANSLVLVHVLFRHGHRTAETTELYPRDPYLNNEYFPFGIGQLTNTGKRREFSIGTTLRERYNSFLGPYYYPDIIEPWTTDYNRTKMSLQLVLASLFPPNREEVWNRQLYWQPIPFNYLNRSEDTILLGVLCPYYEILYDQNEVSAKQQAEFRRYQTEFAYISRNSGLNVTSFLPIYNLFFGLTTEQENGLDLPSWTNRVWPDIITNLATQEYFAATATTELKQMASGYLVKKILRDTKNKIANITERNGRRMYMYSAHENNLAELLILLNIFEQPHIPTYGSYITLEVHNINNVFGIMIYYENYSSSQPQLLKLPGCNTFCPVDQFEALVSEFIPPDNLCFSRTDLTSLRFSPRFHHRIH